MFKLSTKQRKKMDNKTRTRADKVRGMMIRGVPITIPTANNGGKSMQQPRFTAATRKTIARKQKQNEQMKKANNDTQTKLRNNKKVNIDTQTKLRNNKKVNIDTQTELSKKDIDDLKYENDNIQDNLLAQRMRANAQERRANDYKSKLERIQYAAFRATKFYNGEIRRLKRKYRYAREENEELRMKVEAFEEMCRQLNIEVEFDIREVEI